MESASFSSPTFENWAILPPEIQCVTIKNLDNNSRLALRTCSKQSCQLVDSVRFLKLHCLGLSECCEEWWIDVFPTSTSSKHRYEYKSLEEFRNKLHSITEYFDHISIIDVFGWTGKIEWKLENVHVPTLIVRDGNPTDVFRHFNPITLYTINLDSDKDHSGLYNMPQMLHAKCVSIDETIMTDEQLLKLNADQIYLHFANNLTTAGINHFLKKVVGTANDFNCFTIHQSTCFELNEVIAGLDILENKDEPAENDEIIRYKKIENLNFEGNVFERKVNGSIFYERVEIKSNDEAQQLLMDQLKGVIYIKEILVFNWKFNYDVFTQFKNIAVRSLDFRGNSREFLRFIKNFEPKTLKSINVSCRDVESEEVFDTEQLKFSEEILFGCKCRVQDDQLLQLNANQILLRAPLVTTKGMNMLIKKWIGALNREDRNFRINEFYGPEVDNFGTIVSELIEGLDVDIRKNYGPGTTSIIVNTYVYDTQFLVVLQGGCIDGEIIKRDQQFRMDSGEWIR